MFYLNCLGLVVSMSDLDIYVLDYIPSGGCSSQDFRRIKKYFNPEEGIKIPPEIKLRFNLARQKAKKFNMPSRFKFNRMGLPYRSRVRLNRFAL